MGLGKASLSCAVHGTLRGNKYGAIYTRDMQTFHLIERVIDFFFRTAVRALLVNRDLFHYRRFHVERHGNRSGAARIR